MTMVDTMTYVSTATKTDFQTATVTSVSVSTLVEPTTYVSTLLSTRIMDEVSRFYTPFLHPDAHKLNLQTMTVVDTLTATVTENHTQLQTYTQLATRTQIETQTATDVVAETGLSDCLGKCQSNWGLSAGNGNSYNTYASPSPSYTLTSSASSPYMTQGSYNGGSAVTSASAAEASTTDCAGCSD